MLDSEGEGGVGKHWKPKVECDRLTGWYETEQGEIAKNEENQDARGAQALRTKANCEHF